MGEIMTNLENNIRIYSSKIEEIEPLRISQCVVVSFLSEARDLNNCSFHFHPSEIERIAELIDTYDSFLKQKTSYYLDNYKGIIIHGGQDMILPRRLEGNDLRERIIQNINKRFPHKDYYNDFESFEDLEINEISDLIREIYPTNKGINVKYKEIQKNGKEEGYLIKFGYLENKLGILEIE